VTAPASKRQPIPFGKYLLLDRINIGGMAEVWRGKTFGAGGFERLVAIKRILPNIAEDEEFITMFVDEAKITVQLNHANIGQVFDLGSVSNNYYIAMEYISGKDMRAIFDRCRKKGEPPPIPLACYLIAKASEGLDYAHRKVDGRGNLMNIVHRDVSPQNALVSYDGEVKVIDFGIAKAAGKATKTQAGILKGKFGYMSPEQIRGLPLDRRSDVFAIGVCLYEMLTGERLFVGDSDFSVLEKVRKVEVLPPSTYNRKIPEALEKIVMKALAKDVDDRYQYASEVADDLQRFLITSDTVFGRKDLAQYMRATFAEDVEKEKARLSEYADIKPPEGVQFSESGAGFSGPSFSPPSPSAPALTPSGRSTMPPGNAPPAPRLAGEPPRRNSGASMPRLTAVAPLLTNAQAEHEATMMLDADGKPMNAGKAAMPHDTGFDEDDAVAPPDLAALNLESDDDGGPGTIPMLGGNPAAMASRGKDKDAPFAKTYARGIQPLPPASGPGRIGSPATNAARPGPGALPPMRRPVPPGSAPPRPLAPVGVVRDVVSAPARATHAGNEPSQVTEMPKRPGPRLGLIAGIALGALVVLGGGAFAAKALLTGPQGVLLIDINNAHAGKASVTVAGDQITEEGGGPIKQFPVMRKVKAGKVAVLVSVPGFATVVDELDVKEGSELTRYKPKLVKEGAEAPPAPEGGAPPSP
jgi:eukaryotic-like serine/threonine-protein kinase